MSVPSERAAATCTLQTCMLQAIAWVCPLATSYFWLTGPHPWRESLHWACAMLPWSWLDGLAPARVRPHALQLHALSLLQLLNHALLLVTASMLRIDTTAALAQTCATLLPTIALGSAAAAASIRGPARELLQRRSVLERSMGRILLLCALYEPAALDSCGLDERRQLHGRGKLSARFANAATEHGRPLLLLFIGSVFGSLALVLFAVQAVATQRLLERVHRAGERRAPARLAEAPAAAHGG